MSKSVNFLLSFLLVGIILVSVQAGVPLRRQSIDELPKLSDALTVAKSPFEPVTLATSNPNARNDGSISTESPLDSIPTKSEGRTTRDAEGNDDEQEKDASTTSQDESTIPNLEITTTMKPEAATTDGEATTTVAELEATTKEDVDLQRLPVKTTSTPARSEPSTERSIEVEKLETTTAVAPSTSPTERPATETSEEPEVTTPSPPQSEPPTTTTAAPTTEAPTTTPSSTPEVTSPSTTTTAAPTTEISVASFLGTTDATSTKTTLDYKENDDEGEKDVSMTSLDDSTILNSEIRTTMKPEAASTDSENTSTETELEATTTEDVNLQRPEITTTATVSSTTTTELPATEASEELEVTTPSPPQNISPTTTTTTTAELTTDALITTLSSAPEVISPSTTTTAAPTTEAPVTTPPSTPEATSPSTMTTAAPTTEVPIMSPEDKASCNHSPTYESDELQKKFREEVTYKNGTIKGKFTYVNFDQRYRLVHYTRLPYGPVKIDLVEELSRPENASSQQSPPSADEVPNAVLQLPNILPSSLFGFPFVDPNSLASNNIPLEQERKGSADEKLGSPQVLEHAPRSPNLVYTYLPQVPTQYQYSPLPLHTFNQPNYYQLAPRQQASLQPLQSSYNFKVKHPESGEFGYQQRHQPHNHEHYVAPFMFPHPPVMHKDQPDGVRLKSKVKTPKSLLGFLLDKMLI